MVNTYMVDTAGSRTLVSLEVFVHLDLSEDLLRDWDASPPVLATQYIGDDFVIKKRGRCSQSTHLYRLSRA